jgi:hypothetical protein
MFFRAHLRPINKTAQNLGESPTRPVSIIISRRSYPSRSFSVFRRVFSLASHVMLRLAERVAIRRPLEVAVEHHTLA